MTEDFALAANQAGGIVSPPRGLARVCLFQHPLCLAIGLSADQATCYIL